MKTRYAEPRTTNEMIKDLIKDIKLAYPNGRWKIKSWKFEASETEAVGMIKNEVRK